MRRALQRGFTLIEMLVVVAIMILITGMILLDYNRFGGDVILENFAYDVALSVRQAQVYGIAVQRFNTSTFQGYGIHVTTNSPTTYVLYADTEGTGVFDSAASPSEIVETDSITRNYTISSICAVSVYNSTTCVPMQTIDIFFKRPEPSAYISATPGTPAVPLSCVNTPANCQFEARITLLSPKGGTRTVVVDSTGQISVQ